MKPKYYTKSGNHPDDVINKVKTFINELQKVMLDYGVTDVETTGIFETNMKAIQNWKNYDHIQHKRKRCWTKQLA